MKKFFPRALPAWILIVVISALLATQVAFFSIIATDRSEADQIVELYRLNERALWLVKLLSAADGSERKTMVSNLTNSTFAVTVSKTPAISGSISPDDTLAELEDIMVSRLSRYGIADARVRLSPAKRKNGADDAVIDPAADAGEVENDLRELAQDFNETERYTVSLQFKDGQWVNFTTPCTPAEPLLDPESLPIYVGVATFIAILSIWAIRRLIAPYLLLEAAVVRLEEDFRSAPVSETGSREYRNAAKALNSMQKRLLDFVEEREHLAAALAHDLRTPITRMRLRLELLRNSSVRDALAGDIANVELTAKSVIDFVKLRVSDEAIERIDFWSMVHAVADEYPEAVLEGEPNEASRLLCEVQPMALRRCMINLIDNAIKFSGKAGISITSTEDRICLSISDNGPGIPESELESVFRPFSRVEGSRSRKTGGSGLGLTITRSLVQKMGGKIVLSNIPGGGLRADLIVPRIADAPADFLAASSG